MCCMLHIIVLIASCTPRSCVFSIEISYIDDVATHGTRGSVGCPEVPSPSASYTENKAQKQLPKHAFMRSAQKNTECLSGL